MQTKIDIPTLLLKIQKYSSLSQQDNILDTQTQNPLLIQIQEFKKPLLANITTSIKKIRAYINQQQQHTSNLIQDQQKTNSQKYENRKEEKNDQNVINLKLQSSENRQRFVRKSKENRKQLIKKQDRSEPIQWKQAQTGEIQFANYQDMLKNYHNIFENKNKSLRNKQFKHNQSEQGSLYVQQFKMRKQIFNKLKQSTQLVNKTQLAKFLIEHKLVLALYNLDPKQIQKQIKYYQTSQKQYFNFHEFNAFFVQSRLYTQVIPESNRQINNQQVCLLQTDWRILKKIYQSIDIYGKSSITQKKFIDAIKNNQNLLYSRSIYYPDIKKYYYFSKIIHQFEHKPNTQSNISWQKFQNFINNFQYDTQIQTIDIINQRLLMKNKIDGTNVYIISHQFLSLLKKQYDKAHKISGHFIHRDNFLTRLIQHPRFEEFQNLKTRMENYKDLKPQTIFQTLQRIKLQSHNFLDLDQILQFFSFKGRSNEIQYQHDTKIINQITLDSSRYTDNQSYQIKHKNKKVIFESSKLKKITIPQAFKLTEHTKQKIRQNKIQQMIEQYKQKQIKQLQNQFKANPVPKSSTQLLYQALLQKKQRIKQQRLNNPNKQKKNYMPLRLLINPTFWRHKKSQQIKVHCNNKSPQQKQIKSSRHQIPTHLKKQLLAVLEYNAQQRRRLKLQKRIMFYKNRSVSPIIQRLAQSKLQIKQNNQNFNYQNRVKIHANPVPNFEVIHKIEEQKKLKRMKSVPTTKIKEFYLYNKKQKNQKKVQQTSKQLKSRYTIKSHEKYKDLNIQIPQTKKSEAILKKTIYKIEKQKIQLQQKQRQQIEKAEKRKGFAHYMFNKKKIISTKKLLENKTKAKLQQFKKQQKQLQKIQQQNLAQIYSRVLQRPFLYQYSSNKSQKNQTYEKSKIKKITKKRVEKKRQKQEDDELRKIKQLHEKLHSQSQQEQQQEQQRHDGRFQEQIKQEKQHKNYNNNYQIEQEQSASYYDQKNFSF